MQRTYPYRQRRTLPPKPKKRVWPPRLFWLLAIIIGVIGYFAWVYPQQHPMRPATIKIYTERSPAP
ncbi:MAG: hypothetical protein WCO51_10240 [bacterium]